MRPSKTPLLLASICAMATLTGCETVAEEVHQAVSSQYVAMLAPGAGGTGSGKVDVSLNDTTNTVCTDLELSSGVAMTTGHIIGPNNAAIATLEVPGDQDSEDCDTIPDNVVDNIKANPGAYRIHIAATTGDLWGTLRREG